MPMLASQSALFLRVKRGLNLTTLVRKIDPKKRLLFASFFIHAYKPFMGLTRGMSLNFWGPQSPSFNFYLSLGTHI